METKTRVLIADPNEDLRKLLGAYVDEDETMELVGGAGDGAEALDMLGRLKPDVLVTELVLSKLDGAESAAQCAGGEPGHARSGAYGAFERADGGGVHGAGRVLCDSEALRRRVCAAEHTAVERTCEAGGAAGPAVHGEVRAEP